MTSSVTQPNNDTYSFNNILSFNTRTGPSCKWKIGELKLNMKWIYVHEPPEIYWKSIEVVKWTKMFQFVPCITALNYLWGKFHTDVNTISSPKKNLVSYILFYYHHSTRIVARNILSKRQRNEFMNFLLVIFKLHICLFWIASDAMLCLSRVPILSGSRQSGTKRLMRLFTQIENVRMRHFYKHKDFMTPREI